MKRLLSYAVTFNPRWVITVLVISVLAVNINHYRYGKLEVIQHDVRQYYGYLPALFYEGDLSLSFLNDSVSTGTQYWAIEAGNGNKTFKVTMGMAFSYLPFFGLAHAYAVLSGEPANGFSAPYHYAVQFSSLVYFVIGLIFLGKLLRLHFPGFVCSVVLLIISFGTNAFYYLTFGAGMPHAVGFMLCVLFFYQVISWHQTHEVPAAVQMGLLLGALWLVRPVNVLLILVFLLYDVRRWSEVKARFRLFRRKSVHLLLIALCAFAVMIPQLLYWKWNTGELFFYSYKSEGFHFVRPHIIEGLFSFRNGWLIYTPVMFLALAGLFLLRGHLRMYAWAIPTTFVVYIFVIFSWWCWWYGGSFGQRAMIDFYPLLAVPLGAFIYKLRRLGGWYKRILYGVIAVLLVLNLFQTYQAAGNIIHYDSMTARRYVHQFFVLRADHSDTLYLDHPDYHAALYGK